MKKHSLPELEEFQRLHKGPLDSHLNNFTSMLLEQGYAESTVNLKTRLVTNFSKWLHQKGFGINDLDEELIDKFIELQGIQKSVRRGNLAALRVLLKQLRDAGVTPSPTQVIDDSGLHRIEHGFAQYLSEERGLSQATLAYYIPLVRRFLSELFNTDTIQLHELRPTEVSRFILRYIPTVKRSTAKLMVTSLRAFFRYLRLRGEIATDLAEFVPSVAAWRLSDIPKYLEPEQVEHLLESCDQSRSIGQRDYAVLLLLARLGLRAGEVAAMKLDDIDWEAGVLTIRGKGLREDRLPIPHDVGEALVKYLRYGRPYCSTRRVFVRAKAPYQGFSSSVAICNIVQRALLRSKLQPAHKGAHLLRHSLATHMLREGATLAEVGEILRHRLPNTTEIYTKVDMTSLRSLAQPWPGGEA